MIRGRSLAALTLLLVAACGEAGQAGSLDSNAKGVEPTWGVEEVPGFVALRAPTAADAQSGDHVGPDGESVAHAPAEAVVPTSLAVTTSLKPEEPTPEEVDPPEATVPPMSVAVNGPPRCHGDHDELERLTKVIAAAPIWYTAHGFNPRDLDSLVGFGFTPFELSTIRRVEPVHGARHSGFDFPELEEATGHTMLWWGYEVALTFEGGEVIAEVHMGVGGADSDEYYREYLDGISLLGLEGACAIAMTHERSGKVDILALAAGEDSASIPFLPHYARVVDTSMSMVDFAQAAKKAVATAALTRDS